MGTKEAISSRVSSFSEGNPSKLQAVRGEEIFSTMVHLQNFGVALAQESRGDQGLVEDITGPVHIGPQASMPSSRQTYEFET
mmetsp:Transcript_87255/g.164546  ORF Transcript_87255/g.164546 Transcript_87255/m.164546 type:complete len:82 (+) Transcript_87255:176-421(+)